MKKKKEPILKAFKEFIAQGNVLDLAVGVIIGGAFQAIVGSLVKDVIMPVVTLITGGLDFSNWFIALDGKTYATLEEATGVATLNYGLFIMALINFFIMAVVIFAIVRIVRSLSKKKEEPVPTTRKCPYCKTDISKKATRCPNCTSEVEPEEK